MIIMIDTKTKTVIGSEPVEVEKLEAVLKDILAEIAEQRGVAKAKTEEILKRL